MNAQAAIEIRPLSRRDMSSAAKLCARAMRDNPIHVLCFGRESALRERRLRRFFPGLLSYVARKGILLGAWEDARLIGVVGALAPGACRPPMLEALRLGSGLVTSNTPLGALSTARWLQAWLRADPPEPHWHMGPFAVAEAWRGHGVARRLGTAVIAETSARMAAPLYLETDKHRNVRLYATVGFTVIGTRRILGTESWLMMRRPG
jgi:GNAT superfamily N-acetyltransferase